MACYVTVRWKPVRGATWPKRRDDGEQGRRNRRHPHAVLQLARPLGEVPVPRPGRRGPRRPLRSSHPRVRSVRPVPGSALQRDLHHRRRLRERPPGAMPADRRRRRAVAAGRNVPGGLRRRLLPRSAAEQGAAALGPAAVWGRRERRHGRPGAALQREPRRVHD